MLYKFLKVIFFIFYIFFWNLTLVKPFGKIEKDGNCNGFKINFYINNNNK